MMSAGGHHPSQPTLCSQHPALEVSVWHSPMLPASSQQWHHLTRGPHHTGSVLIQHCALEALTHEIYYQIKQLN